RINQQSDLTYIPRVSVDAAEFSEDVAHTNIDLVKGYKALSNEF
ncbi:MAG: carbonate dehydratase, partial [Aeromonas veronii]